MRLSSKQRRAIEQRRKFAAEMIEAAFFGAFVTAIAIRKEEQSLTQVELAKRTGREKTGISKLLSRPRNWQLHTISDLAEALNLRLEFSLVDRVNPMRRFTQTGIEYNLPESPYAGQFDLIGGQQQLPPPTDATTWGFSGDQNIGVQVTGKKTVQFATDNLNRALFVGKPIPSHAQPILASGQSAAPIIYLTPHHGQLATV